MERFMKEVASAEAGERQGWKIGSPADIPTNTVISAPTEERSSRKRWFVR